VGELARLAQTVLLALDADSAGHDAMLRAFSLANKRKLKLRVVPLPVSTDPAELIQRDGPHAIESAIGESVPFVRFRVERVLAKGDYGSAEGRENMVEDLGPVFAELEQGTTQMELIQMVSGRLDLPASLAERLLKSAAKLPVGSRPGQRGDEKRSDIRPSQRVTERRRALSRREDTEREFLALCIASPEEGTRALASLEVDEHFASELLRRAARHLSEGSLREPMANSSGQEGGLDDDPELKGLLAELIVQSGREEARPAMLEVQRLQLEMARMDRKIHQARGQEGGDVSELAQHRAEVKREFDRAYGQVLEETGERAG
jgi:DNA primase